MCCEIPTDPLSGRCAEPSGARVPPSTSRFTPPEACVDSAVPCQESLSTGGGDRTPFAMVVGEGGARGAKWPTGWHYTCPLRPGPAGAPATNSDHHW